MKKIRSIELSAKDIIELLNDLGNKIPLSAEININYDDGWLMSSTGEDNGEAIIRVDWNERG